MKGEAPLKAVNMEVLTLQAWIHFSAPVFVACVVITCLTITCIHLGVHILLGINDS